MEYQNFSINTAEDLVKGFAIGIRDKVIDLTEVRDIVLASTDDERLTQVVLEKVQLELECMEHFALRVAATAA